MQEEEEGGSDEDAPLSSRFSTSKMDSSRFHFSRLESSRMEV